MKKKIDECIELLQNADPTGEIQPDTQEMLQLEDQCYMMGPLIDQQLQKIDYKHAILDDLNIKIIEAFQMYNNLMKESIIKTTNFGQPGQPGQPGLNSNGMNANMMQQQNQTGYIPFVAAPPQADNSLSNQLNNFVNYNTVSNDIPNQNNLPQDQFNAQNYQNFSNNNMYQQYGQGMPQPQVDMNNPNMMPNPNNSYMQINPEINNPNGAQQLRQFNTFNTLPNQ